MKKILIITLSVVLLGACSQWSEGTKAVVCIPVYGQSLALGEEAKRLTDFDSLAKYAGGRIVTEYMDHQFGYFDNDKIKLWVKKMVHYQKRSFELSVYTMAQRLADALGDDTLICIFPGGQGATSLANLSKGTAPYQRFMDDMQTAYNEATSNGWTFAVPAVCWMQGESDIVDYPETDYRELLTKIWQDMNDDIHRITQQQDTIRFIVYQTNSLSRAPHFKAYSFECRETYVPNVFVSLLRDDDRFWASGPTYPYTCVNEKIHINALGQQAIGSLAAQSALGIVRGEQRQRGLIPTSVSTDDNNVTVMFNVPKPPLTLDTLQVSKAPNYGFSVITPSGRDIASTLRIDSGIVTITCSEPAKGCKVRYAVNGDYMKSGNLHGPRGNLRDADGHWCYQFDITH